jgi:hypothetical protein
MFTIPNKLLAPSNKYIYRIKTNINPLPINISFINDNKTAILQRLQTQESELEFTGDYLPNISSVLLSYDHTTRNQSEHFVNLNLDLDLEIFDNSELIDTYKFKQHENYDHTILLLPEKPFNLENKLLYDQEYSDIKNNILIITTELSIIGTIITTFVSDIDKGFSFLIGSSIGIMYIRLLEIGVDAIGKENFVFYKSPVRLLALLLLSSAIISKYSENIGTDHSTFIIGLIGFSMYKIALIASYNQKLKRK